jgi:hypothetical protein
VFVIDLESNTSFGQEMAIQKTVERRSAEGREVLSERTNSTGDTVYVVVATEDEMQAKENATLSKIIRNDGLRLIPADVKEEALEAALKTVADKDAKDPNAAKKSILDAFSEIGVRPLDVVAYLGHSIDNLCKAELEDLRGIYAAIRDGETSWASIMRERSETAPKTEEPGLRPKQPVEPKKEQAPAPQAQAQQTEEQPKAKGKGKPKGSTPPTPPAPTTEEKQGGLNLAPPQEPPKENLSVVEQRKKTIREFMDFAIGTEKDVLDLMRGFGFETDKWESCADEQILTDVANVLADRMREA